MKLADLERAMKGQFVWFKPVREVDNQGTIRQRNAWFTLQTDGEQECSEYLALMVFLGLSEMYGFDRQDVIDHLAISEELYREYRKKYDHYITEAVCAKGRGDKLDAYTIMGKVYVKSSLVRNYINLNYNRDVVRLSDLPNG